MTAGADSKIPLWDRDACRWLPPLGESERLALVREYAPASAYPRGGNSSTTAKMVASLCPIELLEKTSPEELRRKLGQIFFKHKASTPSDDDEYWLAQSPFDGKYYEFAAFAMGGGWPTTPSYVFEKYPDWFDQD